MWNFAAFLFPEILKSVFFSMNFCKYLSDPWEDNSLLDLFLIKLFKVNPGYKTSGLESKSVQNLSEIWLLGFMCLKSFCERKLRHWIVNCTVLSTHFYWVKTTLFLYFSSSNSCVWTPHPPSPHPRFLFSCGWWMPFRILCFVNFMIETTTNCRQMAKIYA